jgi:hypothetical protein
MMNAAKVGPSKIPRGIQGKEDTGKGRRPTPSSERYHGLHMIHEKAKAMTKKEVSGYRTSKLPWGEAGCLEASSMVMMMLASLKLCYMLSKCACIRHLRPARERLPLFTQSPRETVRKAS